MSKIILGCIKISPHEAILHDLNFTTLETRRKIHILTQFHKILFGPAPAYLKVLAPSFFRNLIAISLRHGANVIIPRVGSAYSISSFFC